MPHSSPPPGAASPRQAEELWLVAGSRYCARQPILTVDGKLHAYELLFRSSPGTAFSGDSDQATRTIIDNIVVLGPEQLTGGVPAFINCTMEALTSRSVEILNPKTTVLELLETLEPTPELIAACRALKDRGFQIALDDFEWRPELAPLVDLADYIKVDFILSSADKRRSLCQMVRNRPIKLLAEKVETLEEFQQACAEGFTYFQGYYFCRPTLISSGEIPPNKLAQLQLLRDLQKPDLDLPKISRLVERDAAIAYRLLRTVNSPLYPYRRRVRSVETALIVLGEKAFRRIARLAIASAMSTNAPPALLRMALVRARFCELAAAEVGLDETEQYFLGMFSLLEAMLRIPMNDAIGSLDLRPQIREALTGTRNRERSLLCWMESNERGDWATCEAIEKFHQISEEQFSQIAAHAIEWAETSLLSSE